MGTNQIVREVLKERGKTVPKREIYGLIEKAKTALITKKTRINMKEWKTQNTPKKTFIQKLKEVVFK